MMPLYVHRYRPHKKTVTLSAIAAMSLAMKSQKKTPHNIKKTCSLPFMNLRDHLQELTLTTFMSGKNLRDNHSSAMIIIITLSIKLYVHIFKMRRKKEGKKRRWKILQMQPNLLLNAAK